MRNVKKYDIIREVFEDTRYYGVRFSPDAKYYYSTGFDGPFPVFDAVTNKDIAPACVKEEPPYRWMGEHTLMYQRCDRNAGFEETGHLFDCEEGIAREVKGTAVAFTDGGKSLVVAKLDHTLEKVAVADLKVVWTRQTEPASPSGSPVPDPSAEPVQK